MSLPGMGEGWPSPMIKTFHPSQLLFICLPSPPFDPIQFILHCCLIHDGKGLREEIVSDQLILTNDGPMLTMEEVLYRRHGKRLKKGKVLKKD